MASKQIGGSYELESPIVCYVIRASVADQELELADIDAVRS